MRASNLMISSLQILDLSGNNFSSVSTEKIEISQIGEIVLECLHASRIDSIEDLNLTYT